MVILNKPYRMMSSYGSKEKQLIVTLVQTYQNSYFEQQHALW